MRGGETKKRFFGDGRTSKVWKQNLWRGWECCGPRLPTPRTTLSEKGLNFVSGSKSVLTLGLGKTFYIQMASALARSFRCWHRDSAIQFAIATDQPSEVPHDLREFVEILPVEPGQFGSGFSPKLHLDKIAPAEQTLFVDADCLITGPLEPVFDRFAGYSVSTVGRMISEGDWWGDVRERCEKVGVPEVPVLVGCIYYLEDDSTARAVYDSARELEARYEDLGMIPLRGAPNEEPLVSLGMALHDQAPIPDDGTIKADAMSYPSQIELDVFRGHSLFRDATDQEFLTGRRREAQPVIGHFNDTYVTEDPYTHEAARLRKVQAEGWPLWAADAFAKMRHTIPQRVAKTGKDLLRPLYRYVFGARSPDGNVRATE